MVAELRGCTVLAWLRGCPVLAWLVPLGAALAVFAAVLLTTPPGFGAVGDVLFGSVRGPNAEAAAYAVGAAASLALVTLLLTRVLTRVISWAAAFVINSLRRPK